MGRSKQAFLIFPTRNTEHCISHVQPCPTWLCQSSLVAIVLLYIKGRNIQLNALSLWQYTYLYQTFQYLSKNHDSLIGLQYFVGVVICLSATSFKAKVKFPLILNEQLYMEKLFEKHLFKGSTIHIQSKNF